MCILCTSCGGCSATCALLCGLMALLWLLGASGLLYLTWNRVVAQVSKLKAINFVQALLVIVTMAVLCLPKSWNQKGPGCFMGGCEPAAVSGSKSPCTSCLKKK